MAASGALKRIGDAVWELPVSFRPGMRVPARVYGTTPLIEAMDETVFEQIANVATLPGIVGHALCMPDGHFGYGFPIGGVAAMDVARGGVISPGGIGFDINCGMRLVRTNLRYGAIAPHLRRLVDRLFETVPTGVGASGAMRLSRSELRRICEQGARWCVDNGLGHESDLAFTEEGGAMAGADPSDVSDHAIERGLQQLGTLGSGNHYLEIQVVRPENVYDPALLRRFRLDLPEQVTVMFHCGSRGFGHQVATDYLQRFLAAMRDYGIEVPDRELACLPFRSPEAQAYFSAMKCAMNVAYANRQVILHRVREVFRQVLGRSDEALGMETVYDVSHNTAKLERHRIDGEERMLLVHRKGATRALGPGAVELPDAYHDIGQPVIIGGSMETGSYLLVGAVTGADSFFSTAHGSGRTMSRHQARRQWRGRALRDRMAERGIYLRSASDSGLAEEAGGAYKDIDSVASASELAGLSRRVVRFVPVGNIKG